MRHYTQNESVLTYIKGILIIKKGNDKIVKILDKRIKELEKFEKDSQKARDLLYAYRNAITNLRVGSADIESIISDKEYIISLEDLKRNQKRFEIVYERQIKAPVKLCFGKKTKTLVAITNVVLDVRSKLSRLLSKKCFGVSKFFTKPSSGAERQLIKNSENISKKMKRMCC